MVQKLSIKNPAAKIICENGSMLGPISWLAWLVRNEEDRHKEKRDSEDTDEYWEDTPVKSGAPQPVVYKRQDDERQKGDQASCRVVG